MTVRAARLGGWLATSISRRDVLLSAAALATSGRVARSQGRVRRIGFVEAGSRRLNGGFLRAFRDAMRALGWTDGDNIAIVEGWAEGNGGRLPSLVDDVIYSGIDVLVTGAAPAAIASGKVTRTIPVVLVGEPDPVAFGLAESLSQPGANVTGLTSLSLDLVERQFRLLRETTPKMARVAALAISQQPGAEGRWRYVETSAERLRVMAVELKAADPEGIDRAFVLLHNYPADALWVDFDGSVIAEPGQVVALATAARLPAIYPSRSFTEAGGLMSCGADFTDMYRRAATFADKILKGANPGDLPFEPPAKFDLAVNPKAAAAIGLKIPQALLAGADKIIESDVVPPPLAAVAAQKDQDYWLAKFDKTGN